MVEMKKLSVFLVVIVLYIGNVFWGGDVWAQNEGGMTIGYQLPYPGILPDSPIYFLKVARDQTMLWLIRDDGHRAFYLLLLSDKRMTAGESLINHSKKSVGAMSIVKSEEYFGQAVDFAMVAKNKGMDTSDLFAKLTVSSAKHREVISQLSVKLSGKDSEQLTKARLQNENSVNRVREIFFQAMGVGR